MSNILFGLSVALVKSAKQEWVKKIQHLSLKCIGEET